MSTRGTITYPVFLAAALLPAGLGQAASPSLTCSIEAEPFSGGMQRVAPVVRAEEGAAGTYSFKIIKQDGAGSSASMQSGSFDLEAGGEQTLSVVAVSVNPGGAIRAVLVLNAGKRTTECERSITAP